MWKEMLNEKKSEALFRSFEKAKTASVATEVGKRETELLRVHHEKVDEMILGHKQNFRTLAMQEDRLRGEIALLGRNRIQKIEEAKAELEKCLKPWKLQASEKLRKVYTELEKEKAFKRLGEPRFDFMQREVYRITTNIFSILESQRIISATATRINDAVAPISELQKMLDEAEKTIPKEFLQTELSLRNDELLQWTPFFPDRNSVVDDTWVADIQSPEVIQRAIDGLMVFTKPRQQVAA
jgi:hypothetical protein